MVKQRKWKTLIADDEPVARRGVRQLLAAFPEFLVASECRNGAEVLAALDVCAPDVIFLDIKMPGIDGLEVIRRRNPEHMPAVVFLTAFDQYAIRAFEADALDYLVKPVSEERFAATIRRLLRRLTSTVSSTREESIVVRTSHGTTVLPVNKIDWIEAAGNYSQLWIGPRKYFLRESLQLLEERLRKYGFIRAHRRGLVRVESVRELTRTSAGALFAVLNNGARIQVSRRRSTAFAQAVRFLGKAFENDVI